MEDVIRLQDQYYILATSARADDRTRVLKHGDTFAVFDRYGDIAAGRPRRAGPLPRGHALPLRLRAAPRRQAAAAAQLDRARGQRPAGRRPHQPRRPAGRTRLLPRGTLHVFRSKFLWQAGLLRAAARCATTAWRPVSPSRWRCASTPTSPTSSRCAARRAPRRGRPTAAGRRGGDADRSATRGSTRSCAGRASSARRAPDVADGQPRRASSCRWPPAERRSPCSDGDLRGDGEPAADGRTRSTHGLRSLRESPRARRASSAHVDTANEQFNELDRPLGRRPADDDHRDRRTARTRTPACRGSARRSAATASSPRCELLWVDPADRARRARLPGRHAGRPSVDPGAGRRAGQDPARDAAGRDGGAGRDPVRPLLRQRRRDAAVRRAGRAPTTSAPATASSSQAIWPNVEARADVDRHLRRSATATASSSTTRRVADGLVQQGWKDSHDSVFHADGTLAEAPIALCEVQGYVYAAKRGAAELAGAARPASARGRAAARRPTRPARALRGRRSGARTSAPTRSRSTATSGRAGCARRTPATACSPASPSRRAAARVAATLLTGRGRSPAGACARWPRPRRATTRCRTTTARSGRTTTR